MDRYMFHQTPVNTKAMACFEGIHSLSLPRQVDIHFLTGVKQMSPLEVMVVVAVVVVVVVAVVVMEVLAIVGFRIGACP